MIGKRTDEEVLEFIDAFWDEYWTSPSYEQIGNFASVSSKSVVSYHLKRLVAEGALEEKRQLDIRRSVLYRRP